MVEKFNVENSNIILWQLWQPDAVIENVHNYLVLWTGDILVLNTIQQFEYPNPKVYPKEASTFKENIKTLDFSQFSQRYPAFPQDEQLFEKIKDLAKWGQYPPLKLDSSKVTLKIAHKLYDNANKILGKQEIPRKVEDLVEQLLDKWIKKEDS